MLLLETSDGAMIDAMEPNPSFPCLAVASWQQWQHWPQSLSPVAFRQTCSTSRPTELAGTVAVLCGQSWFIYDWPSLSYLAYPTSLPSLIHSYSFLIDAVKAAMPRLKISS